MRPNFIVPCLWFDDQAEDAARFYLGVFPDGQLKAVSRYPTDSDNPGGRPRGSVLTVEFEVAGQGFTALNGGPVFSINPSISFFVHVDTVAEAERCFGQLAEGGEALMPFGAWPWSEGYGWVKDRFGVTWQVIAGWRQEGGAVIVPCLMFSGPQAGRAEEALTTWAELFPGGEVVRLERYGAGEGVEGTIKHGRARVGGQELIAMDSHAPHAFNFNEGVSLQVGCQDQELLDRYWTSLSEGGAPGQCGWLKDRFGVSWQVVPSAIADWIACEDPVARDRASEAMLEMEKLDIAGLKGALDGPA